MNNNFYSFYLFYLVTFVSSVEFDFRCSKTFCNDYIEAGSCPDITKCQKVDHILLDGPGPCNCCKLCLKLLKEAEECDQGQIGQMNPDSICGPGLQCFENICKTMETECTKKQKEWDEKWEKNTLGSYQLRPLCDDNGKFSPGICQPATGICHCLDEDGKRIHGEVIFENATSASLLSCECSRKHKIASTLFSDWADSFEFARCTTNGQYEEIQCVNNKCFCVETLTGAITDNYYVSKENLKPGDLSCYPLETTLVIERPCEDDRRALREITGIFTEEDIIILGSPIPSCLPDGTYDRVQVQNGVKQCVDPNGQLLSPYQVPLSSPSSITMNCKCARTVWMVKNGPYPLEYPTCTSNGNFQEWQCRRGWCFCVDEDGNQLEQEVPEKNVNELKCFGDAF